jgi:SAM-dependent methyltransferase
MGGTSMAVMKRWKNDSFYTDTVFNGTVLDIGAAGDPLARYRAELPNITHVTGLDLEPMPGQLPSCDWIQAPATQVPEWRQWDVVYSSHCLEHLEPAALPLARQNWWKAVNPGGYLVLIVPDMEMYERGHWPSRYNNDHKTRWVWDREGNEPADVMSLREFVRFDDGELMRLNYLSEGFDPNAPDQTGNGACECGIEAVVRKQG